jgi:adenylate cyclase
VGETRKLAAILVADLVGYSRLAGADEDRKLARFIAGRRQGLQQCDAAHELNARFGA